jgi:hypothetical protein
MMRKLEHPLEHPLEHAEESQAADAPAVIDTVREHPSRRSVDDMRPQLRELGDAVRDAMIPDRLAEAMAHRLQRGVSDGIRDVLRECLARELRNALQDAAMRGGDSSRAMALLNVRLSDAIEDRARDVLSEGTPELVGERLPNALRAAVADTAFVRRFGPMAIDDLAERMQTAVTKAVRQRLRDGLRHVLRARFADLARERLSESFRSAVAAGHDDSDAGDAGAVAATLGEAIEHAIHERLLGGVMDRFRSIVSNSLHEATGERVGDGLSQTLSWAAGQHASITAGASRAGSAESFLRLAQAVERPVGDAVRSRLIDGLRERIEATIRTNVDEVLHERLAGAVRNGIAQQADAEKIDTERLADAIHYELAEVVRARICDGIHARTAEAVRTRLADAIRSGLSRARVTE